MARQDLTVCDSDIKLSTVVLHLDQLFVQYHFQVSSQDKLFYHASCASDESGLFFHVLWFNSYLGRRNFSSCIDGSPLGPPGYPRGNDEFQHTSI